MKFNSRFNIGDLVWVPAGPNYDPVAVTIGQINIKHTHSKGREGEELSDNYKPQEEYKETYMCDETGIGSGSVWELGKNIFASKEECEQATAFNTGT